MKKGWVEKFNEDKTYRIMEMTNEQQQGKLEPKMTFTNRKAN